MYKIKQKLEVISDVEISDRRNNIKLEKGQIFFVRLIWEKKLIGTIIQLVRYDMKYFNEGILCPIAFFTFVEGSEYEKLFKNY